MESNGNGTSSYNRGRRRGSRRTCHHAKHDYRGFHGYHGDNRYERRPYHHANRGENHYHYYRRHPHVRSPSPSLSGFALLELQRQLRKFQRTVLGELIWGHRNVSPASPHDNPTLTSSSNAGVDATSTSIPLGEVQTGPAPVRAGDRRITWSSDTFVVPPGSHMSRSSDSRLPLGPRPCPRPRSRSSGDARPPFAPSTPLPPPPPAPLGPRPCPPPRSRSGDARPPFAPSTPLPPPSPAPLGPLPLPRSLSPSDSLSYMPPPPYSLRAIAKHAWRCRLRDFRHSDLGVFLWGFRHVFPPYSHDNNPTLTSSSSAGVDAASTSNPLGGVQTGPTPVQAGARRNSWSGDLSPLPPPPPSNSPQSTRSSSYVTAPSSNDRSPPPPSSVRAMGSHPLPTPSAFAPSTRASPAPVSSSHDSSPQPMPSSSYDTVSSSTASSNRRGPPPLSSLRAFAKIHKLELKRQLSASRRAVSVELDSKPINVAPASPRDAPTRTSSNGAGVTSTPNPSGSATRGSAPVPAPDRQNPPSDRASLVPAPLHLHLPGSLPDAPARIFPGPLTSNPPGRFYSAPGLTFPPRNFSRPFFPGPGPGAVADGLTIVDGLAIVPPAPVVQARPLQANRELELPMVELERELEQSCLDWDRHGAGSKGEK